MSEDIPLASPFRPRRLGSRSRTEIHHSGSFRSCERDSPSSWRAIEAGRKPGMPLSILSNIAREAPLGSLLVAFLLGVAVARRR